MDMVTCPNCGRDYETSGCRECPFCMHVWDDDNKAAANNYRQGSAEKNCCFCALKQGVPWMWCDQVGRQVELGNVCDRHRGA